MQRTCGYAGKQLRVWLDKKETKEESLDPAQLRDYIGGVGYGARILYDELKQGIDPLGPENKLVFATGPLTGNNMPGGGSIEICFKSPLTGGWGESRSGGDFGPELKKAGYDFVILEGRSEEPVYLLITDSVVELRPAQELVGKNITEKTEIIKNQVGDGQLVVMCIGPGGENQVLFATLMCGDRAAGRCGVGAVMGAKNLLAVAVRGKERVKPADNEKFMSAVRAAMQAIKANPNADGFREHGTAGDIPSCDSLGDWPTKNWQANSWGKGEAIYNHYFEHNLVRNNECYQGCPVGCSRILKVDAGEFKTPVHEGGEYESISAFTAFVLNEDVDAAVHSTYLCNEYGIDTISAGAVIAFAMECYEHGLIKGVDGLDLSWGNPRVLPILVKMIAHREGIGNLLAEGVLRATKKLGPKAEEFAIHGKGLEAPAHDPRSGKALAVTYATANRGLCHIHPLEGMAYDLGKNDFGLSPYGIPDPEHIDRWDEIGKGKIVKILQDGCVIPDVVVTCKFMMYCGLNLERTAAIIAGLTGWDIDGAELLQVGERVSNLQRLFNIREGFTKEDDILPARMKNIPAFGPYSEEERCGIIEYETMLAEYYEARGWDPRTGAPLPQKLNELGL